MGAEAATARPAATWANVARNGANDDDLPGSIPRFRRARRPCPSSAKEVLLVCSEMVESSYEPSDTDEEDDEDSGSGGSGTPGSSRNGGPDASDPGNVPQAQAIHNAEPNVWGSGNEVQLRQDLVEVSSFDDIDDGPCEPPDCPGSRVPPAVDVPQAAGSSLPTEHTQGQPRPEPGPGPGASLEASSHRHPGHDAGRVPRRRCREPRQPPSRRG